MDECVLIWTDEVQPALMALSAPKMKDLSNHCYLLMYRAEYFRQHPKQVICIGVAPLQQDERPFAPFYRHGHWFRLEMTTNAYFGQREYALKFANMPPPDRPDVDDNDDTHTFPAKAVKPGKKGQGARISAQAASVRKPRRKAAHERNVFISYVSYNIEMQAKFGSAIWTLLARSLHITRESVDYIWRRGLEWAQHLDVCLHSVNTALRRIRALIEAESPGSATPVSRYGRLEPRLFGQNLGVHLLLHTMVFEDPIDWSADLFGVPDHQGEQATA